MTAQEGWSGCGGSSAQRIRSWVPYSSFSRTSRRRGGGVERDETLPHGHVAAVAVVPAQGDEQIPEPAGPGKHLDDDRRPPLAELVAGGPGAGGVLSPDG